MSAPDPLIAAENLKQCKEALYSLGIPFFLFLGTALGAYRDKDFCPGDIDDIDIAIPVEYFSRFDEISEAMRIKSFEQGSSFDMPATEQYPYGIAPERAFVKYYDGWKSKIDIFFITPYEDKMSWVFYASPPQIRLVDKHFFSDFEMVEFYGEIYHLPTPVPQYLEANYGPDWETPIHRDNYLWSRDNKCPIV